MTAPDDVRARFEASMREMWGDDDFNPARHPETPDAYRYIPEQSAWEGYRAAHADLAGEVRESYTPFPQMPSGLVIHPKLGPLFDRMQMQSYAMKFLDAALAKFHPTHQEKP